MSCILEDLNDAPLQAIVHGVLNEIFRWEREHPGRESRERGRAENVLRDRCLALLSSYQACLRDSNKTLLAEVIRLKTITVEPMAVGIVSEREEKGSREKKP